MHLVCCAGCSIYSSFYCYCQILFLLVYLWAVECSKTSEDSTSLRISSCDSTSNVRKITSNHPTQGLLTSAGYPRPYPSNQHCVFELSVPVESGLVIHLIFLDLDLDDNTLEKGYVVENICQSLCVPCNPMLKYEFTAEGTESDVEALSGQITSPGFPYTYPRNVTCNWLIRVRPNKRIYVRLLHLELSLTMAECEKASLVIIDGYRHEVAESSARKFSTKSSPEIKYCGGHLYYNEEGMKSYLSTSNRVLIRFVTKDNPSSDQVEIYEQEGTPIGFRLLWTEIDSLVVNPNSNDVPGKCPGFLCQGGEFCADDGHNICAERTRLCINKTLQCDGVSNCAENDNSDEFYCYPRNPLTLAGVATAFCLFLLLLAVILFTYRTHLRYKRKQKHRQIESTRREYSEKMAAVSAAAAKSTNTNASVVLAQKQKLVKTPVKQQQNASDNNKTNASLISKKQLKQRTVSVSSNTSSSIVKPKTTNVCTLKASPQLSVYSRLDVSNGLQNSRLYQESEPAVWQMAPQRQDISRRLQTDRCRTKEYKEAGQKEQEELAGGNSKDAFTQSISIIQRALV